ncbi:retrovirus-related Pol polyprotein from type-1 retrotransposable element R2 [Clonorchis sinensis]|uniref:Retrovirus-related Pol polyprotein from type-1 retrotransposable element R2 n=1 Tax=Clonorchis sinensis TaxID=79923 RepID=G7YVQ0_CLOSI|nr:retrovirus-related Pol polyprotein from type-1 retrotransposable element R2 [Clonorchis sinensis]
MKIGARKTKAMVICGDRKHRATAVSVEPFCFAEELIIPLGPTDTITYLGSPFNFKGRGVFNHRQHLPKLLDEVTRAPLKPHQRMEITRNPLISRLTHSLVLGQFYRNTLRRLENYIRQSFRDWLRLTKDTPISYIHAGFPLGHSGKTSASLIPHGPLSVPDHLLYEISECGRVVRKLYRATIGVLLTVSGHIAMIDDPGLYVRSQFAGDVQPMDLGKEKSHHYATTTGSFHDPKILSEELQVTRALPPPHHWNVHYINDFRSRYLAGRHYRPLSPSHQKSETHDEFRKHDSPSEVWRPIGMQPFVLDNHHKEGPSKKIVASTVNPPLRGRTLLPKDKEVLRHLDPYLTTTMKEHRMWTPEELEGYAKKDTTTYWELESYPKAWGFGLKSNPIPKESVPRERLPLRDRVLFKEATDQTRVRPVTFHVPHTSRLKIHIRYTDDV